MDEYGLLVDLHKAGERQGPGGEDETRRALSLASIDRSAPMRVADIGCGTGASTLVLAQELSADITAVDLFDAFLERLEARIEERRIRSRVRPMACAMEELPFAQESLDLIWSEGAIYSMGFERGISEWRRFLKPGGGLVVSEVVWLAQERPAEIEAFWKNEYPEIDLPSAKIGLLERHGYRLDGYFVLPPHCWWENYYRPLRSRFDPFLEAHGNSEHAQELVESTKEEIELYLRYGAYFGYGFFIARRDPLRDETPS